MTGDITVTFAGGTYPIPETVTMGPEHSPKDDFTITYQAADGETPIYTDEGSAHIVCQKNVIESPYKKAHAATNYGRKHTLIIDHYFVTEDTWKDGCPTAIWTNHVVCSADNWPEEAREIIRESGLEPEWKVLLKRSPRALMDIGVVTASE